MTLQDAINEIQAVLRKLPGIKDAPKVPPDNIGEYPYIVTYAGTGEWRWNSPEDTKALHSMVSELHVARAHLPTAIQASMQYSDSIPLALFRGVRDGLLPSIDTFERITYVYGPLGWSGVLTFGWAFTVHNIKIRTEIGV